jgi:hypothetical protein
VIYANALYAIISHGKDGKGSYKHLNGTLTSCDATALDKENCDSDIVIIDTAPNNSSIAANFYDDYVVWAPKYLLGISAAGSSPTTATALGYQLVNGTACNGASSCSATCPGGKVLIGGGCRGTNGSHVHPEDLYPFSTTQWRCRTAGAVTTLQAYAICITQ